MTGSKTVISAISFYLIDIINVVNSCRLPKFLKTEISEILLSLA